ADASSDSGSDNSPDTCSGDSSAITDSSSGPSALGREAARGAMGATPGKGGDFRCAGSDFTRSLGAATSSPGFETTDADGLPARFEAAPCLSKTGGVSGGNKTMDGFPGLTSFSSAGAVALTAGCGSFTGADCDFTLLTGAGSGFIGFTPLTAGAGSGFLGSTPAGSGFGLRTLV